ncbi:hypothetical protein CORC01_08745 [Colletotrichum orchidophilum]|uniref:Eisosome protein 1 n=1 Tax=Colletotrichum orchidophilum TaxID=1209926 RepID=A0A1G4B3I1_9PEZI|nr:uncharacterized protein CORC01_08745 [Colletotrichum orchidophilum]OHE95893.1 hypothetical protein CORC01_08745 [Colletotrichum orchidophilum]
MMQANSKTATQQQQKSSTGMAETRYQVPSTAPHSGRLKYADPRDLPSFPSPGLPSDGAAAGAAASLGWANQKSIDLWKPEKSNSASTAAMLAKDYKMAPSWEPNSSSAGAKAALLASASAKKQSATNTTPPPSATESWGSSAANQAFKQSRSVKQPPQTASTAGLGSLSAAQNAMPANRRTRPRAKSTPVPKESYPGESRAAANALSAATAAHSPSLKPKSPTENTGSVPYTNLPRSMFTSKPAIGPEEDEKKRADVLHASAVAMAKKMYSQQQRMVDQARVHQAAGETSPDGSQSKPYVNLQEAAYKLAQERLSKLHVEHHKNRDYQEYYGSGTQTTPQRRFTMKGKLRRRSSSDGNINEDKEQSERIRREMSIFSSSLTKVDEQKRAQDREALLATAQRNVKARLQGMDDKISAETGMVAPSSKSDWKSDWESKAHMAAMAKHESANVNRGKVDIGGGMFMDPEAVDEIATRRVQPVLDEINEKAAIERERQEMLKAEAEAKKRDEEKRKERDREVKEINRKVIAQEKQEEKEKRHREKQELKAKKEEEKAVKAEEKRKSKLPEITPGESAVAAESSEVSPVSDDQGVNRAGQQKPTINTHRESSGSDNPRSPSDSGSPTNKMKSWLKSRFGRPRGRSAAGESAEERGFIGGVALTRLANESATSLDARSASMREVAIAGKSGESPRSSAAHDGDVSPVSSDNESEHFVEASDDLEGPVSPPAAIRDPNTHKTHSPTRDSRFRENLE